MDSGLGDALVHLGEDRKKGDAKTRVAGHQNWKETNLPPESRVAIVLTLGFSFASAGSRYGLGASASMLAQLQSENLKRTGIEQVVAAFLSVVR